MSGTLIKQRDYGLIAGIERDFFTGLTRSAGQFRGAHLSGGDHCTVEAALSAAAKFISASRDATLDITVCFDLRDCRPRNSKYVDRMYLGTRLTPNQDPKEQQVTHFVALAKGDSCEVKKHIDLDFHSASDEPKPSPHIQIGGRPLKIRNRELSFCWKEYLDKPRWPSLPCCTPLLWHTAFLEFQECSSVLPFLKQGWWKNLVREAEKTLWLPFFNDMSGLTSKGCAIEAFYPPSTN